MAVRFGRCLNVYAEVMNQEVSLHNSAAVQSSTLIPCITTTLFETQVEPTFRSESQVKCHAHITQLRATMLAASKYVSDLQLGGGAAKSCVRNYV